VKLLCITLREEGSNSPYPPVMANTLEASAIPEKGRIYRVEIKAARRPHELADYSGIARNTRPFLQRTVAPILHCRRRRVWAVSPNYFAWTSTDHALCWMKSARPRSRRDPLPLRCASARQAVSRVRPRSPRCPLRQARKRACHLPQLLRDRERQHPDVARCVASPPHVGEVDR
jgi:hypothetical protein